MNWFKGNIAEAVTQSKRKNAIFVVFVAGPDELSTNLAALVDNDIIRKHLESEKFVAIRIESGSEAYQQFAQIYQLVPLPSIFFIGQNGTPLDIVTSLTTNVEDLEKKINGVLKLIPSPSATGGSPSASAPAQPTAEAKPTTPEKKTDAEPTSPEATTSSSSPTNTTVVCEDGVCRRVEAPSPSASAAAEPPIDDKVARAKELIEKKRKEKEAEEARQEREKELQRRRQGQDVAALKKWQEDQELKQLKEDRRREKKEADEARKKILEQIEQDKRERAQKFAPIPPKSSPAEEKQNHHAPVASDTSRIQFKTPSGGTEVHVFASTDQFSTVRSFVQQEILSGSGIRDFALATTFPRREFSEEHNTQTLTELSLTPSAVLLIIPQGRGGPSSGTMRSSQVATASPGSTAYHFITSLLWSFLSPVVSVLTYIKNWAFSRQDQGQQKRAAEEQIPDHDAAKRRNLQFPGDGRDDGPQPSTSKAGEAAYKRLGASNIHRLHDRKDSDDENNTWNGNSTQQM
uniref:UBX domain-containing protein 4 n=1 Tax=Lutzomyia longipalpis TaxID=7200 RepID=A0A7G3B2P2_LUTLO